MNTKNKIILFLSENEHIILLIGSLIAIIYLIVIGYINNWDITKINYTSLKFTELSTGFLVSVGFYYINVFFPSLRKKRVVIERIKKLLGIAITSEYRVLNNLKNGLSFNKPYEDLSEDDFKEIMKRIDQLKLFEEQFVYNLLDSFYGNSLIIGNHLEKVLIYYKEFLDIESLRLIEESLESLHYKNTIKEMPIRINSYFKESSMKFEKGYDDFYSFDKKIKELKERWKIESP